LVGKKIFFGSEIMPTPLQRPNPQKRKSGWLLRDSYKEDMKVERTNVRERMNNPKFNPLKSAKYNVKRSVYRSVNIPQISKALEEYVKEGILSKSFAKTIVQDLVNKHNIGLVQSSSREELIGISKNPKKGIENNYHKISAISEHEFDPVTKNRVTIQRLANGNITVIVRPLKK
jgi:polyhydroxyalkanoate synthesis regulator phasin